MARSGDRPSLFEGVRLGRFIFWLAVGSFLMMGTLFAWRRTEEFLIKDDRFRIGEADELVQAGPNLTIEGIRYASAAQMRQLFAEDFGRSLYLVPIEERRQELLKIDWVEDAAVSRMWPNSIRVWIRERTPVAFIHLPPRRRGGDSQFALIDKDGYILRPRVAARFTLPVISGVRESETLENRRARVRRVLDMLKEVGPLARQISEINVADPNDLVVADHVGNSVVNLMLGDEHYSERIQNFLANYGEIKERRPDATTLDLRVDGIITAVGGQP
jgi:cell division protein FtsQ